MMVLLNFLPLETDGKAYLCRTATADPRPTLLKIYSSDFDDLRVYPVLEKRDSLLWNEYIQRYHYLGYAPMPGDQIRYFVRFAREVTALLWFRADVWKTDPEIGLLVGVTHNVKKIFIL